MFFKSEFWKFWKIWNILPKCGKIWTRKTPYFDTFNAVTISCAISNNQANRTSQTNIFICDRKKGKSVLSCGEPNIINIMKHTLRTGTKMMDQQIPLFERRVAWKRFTLKSLELVNHTLANCNKKSSRHHVSS